MTSFSILPVASLLIQRPKVHSLDKVLCRGQFLEIPYLGCDLEKISHELSLEIAYLGQPSKTSQKNWFKKSRGMFKTY